MENCCAKICPQGPISRMLPEEIKSLKNDNIVTNITLILEMLIKGVGQEQRLKSKWLREIQKRRQSTHLRVIIKTRHRIPSWHFLKNININKLRDPI